MRRERHTGEAVPGQGPLGAGPGLVRRWLPGLALARGYRREWLRSDLQAGVALSAVLVPAGLGYAQAAGLPAVVGLHATVAGLLAYALFGPSRVLVLGPDSALAGLIAATVLPLAGGAQDRAVALAGLLCILAGLACVAGGLARLGFVADLLSLPIRYGYLNGLALVVLVGQLPAALGVAGGGTGLLAQGSALAAAVGRGEARAASAGLALGCLLLILACRRWAPRVPGVLLAVGLATALCAGLSLDRVAGVAVLGPLPPGVSLPGLPAASLADVGAVAGGALAVALLAFADTSLLSRAFAARARQRVDGSQELVALGLANLAAGLFHGVSVSGSASRTAVAEAAGARTQLAGVVGAACVLGLLLGAPGLLRDLPVPALAAVVVAACLGLVEVRGVLRLARWRPGELALSAVCFLGVALVGVLEGIFLSVALSLAALVWRTWRPYQAVLGRVEGLEGYHDLARHPAGRAPEGVVLFRWDAPLFFANAGIFRDQVRAAVAGAPTPTRWVVVTAEPVTDVDVTAAEVLEELAQELAQAGVGLCFAELKGPVKDRLKRYGLFERLGADRFFPTIDRAVEACQARRPEAGPPGGG